MRAWLRAGMVLAGLLVLSVLAGGLYVRSELRASLPQVDGTRQLPGLTAPVTVTRDALGVPTITGGSRVDVARALGFVHAQDRFFQMDLQRRQPAGELSALVGAAAVDVDAAMRVHRFRQVARAAYARTSPDWKAIVDAYAEGVNTGISALGAPPFEYLVLRATPEPWRPEDTILTVLAMFDSLQGRQAAFERTNQQLRDALPEPLFRFLTAVGSEWEAPAAGEAVTRPPVPGPEVADLRARGPHPAEPSRVAARTACASWPLRLVPAACQSSDEAAVIGSNNWAVDAAHADGGALLANDMHLGISVPNIWYRASMVFPDPADALGTQRITGITLPGIPTLVVGSTGYVAWGFTNTGGDWSDLIRVDADPHDPGAYLTPDGPEPFEVATESIAVKGADPRPLTVRSTRWGPIVWTDVDGHAYAQHWVAHDPDVLASDLSQVERTRSVDELLVVSAGLGIPNQNLTMADRTGRVAWTIGGRIPKRYGLDGFTSESWADGTRGWDGYVAAVDYPRIVDPPGGRIWTANAAVVGGADLALIGDGGLSDGIRARIIRDRLLALPHARAPDMLAIQLDNQSLFLDRWRTLALDTVARAAASAPADRQASRAGFARLIETTWDGHASPPSAAYRLVRTFRAAVVRRTMAFLTAPALARDPSFDYTRSPRAEGPVWQLVTARPPHLLDPAFTSWDDLRIASVDAATAELAVDGGSLADRTWGEVNRARITHPLSGAVPFLSRWLDMPADPLPGDVFTPRAHSPRTGPSERMVVSPGREESGILHMPVGQSAHPLSPHYADMHRAWVLGESVPFLPGPAAFTLTLTP
ncbi:MAG: penicillin acylase family protein [Vicinamibacterales bacterium]